MEEQAPEQEWITQPEYCYRHPTEQTRVHCTRCGRPICPDCMIPAPVGHQCPECVGEARRAFRQGPARNVRTLTSTSMSRAILVVLVAAFVVELVMSGGGTPTSQTLIDMGALVPPLVAHGQWWRLMTVIYLHANLLHIALNAWALLIFGQFVESSFRRWQFLTIFFVGGFMGSVASYVFGSPFEIGVGASGAIVGLFGAFIAYNFRRRHLALAQGNLRMALMIIVLNVVLTAFYPGIDYRAHLGGLFSGIITGYILEGAGPRQYQALVRVAGVIALVGVGIALVAWRTSQLQPLIHRFGL